MRIFILDFFVKTVGYFDKNDKTIWSYPFFSNKKEYCSCEIAATYAGFGYTQVGMATKIFVLILHVTGDQCQLWVVQELEIIFRCSNSSMGNVRPLQFVVDKFLMELT